MLLSSLKIFTQRKLDIKTFLVHHYMSLYQINNYVIQTPFGIYWYTTFLTWTFYPDRKFKSESIQKYPTRNLTENLQIPIRSKKNLPEKIGTKKNRPE